MSEVIRGQVSEGFPADGKIFEPPVLDRDNEKPRYLTFLGSLIDAETVRSRPWTKGGGLDCTNPCLRVVKNFIRKGRITPLLRDTHDFLPFDYVKKTTEVNPLQAGYFAQPIPQGYVPPSLPPSNGQFQPGFGNLAVGGPSPYGNHVGRLAVPGEQINAILIGPENMAQGNVPRGVRELVSLRGHDYKPSQRVRLGDAGEFDVDPEIWQMQLAIFPSYPVLPVLLDETERLLDAASDHTFLRPIVDEMYVSLNQFRDYASASIQNTHYQMKEAAVRGGYVWRYTAMDLVLLEQLGMERQDRQIRETAKAGGNERLEGMFEQWLAIQIEEKQANLDRMKRTGEASATPEIDASTMMAAPSQAGDAGQEGQSGTSGFSGASGEVALANEAEVIHELIEQPSTASDVPVEMQAAMTRYPCGCGKSFDTERGLATHRNLHCEITKAQKAE